MPNLNQLGLHEEVLLLGKKDDSGTFYHILFSLYAVAGGILMELLLNERIRLGGSEEKYVELVNSVSIGNPLLDECLQALFGSEERVELKSLVDRITSVKPLLPRVEQGLCDRGILVEKEKRVLLFFFQKCYPLVDPAPKYELIERIREAIFTDSTDVATRTAVVVTLANHANLLHRIFGRKSLRQRRERIAQISDGDAIGDATKQAIDALRASSEIAMVTAGVVGAAGVDGGGI